MAIFTGTSGNDTLSGTSANDIFQPLLGVDSVSGGGGFDLLTVNYASLTLNGGTGTIISDPAGFFSGSISAGPGTASVAFTGIESLSLVLSGGADTVSVDATGLASGGLLDINGGAGLDTLKADFAALGSVQFNQGANFLITASHGTWAGFEAFDLALGGGVNTVTLQGGNDIVRSTGGVDRIAMGAGTDLWLADFSSWTSAISFGWDGDRNIAAVSNGAEVTGVEGGMVVGGSADDAFFLSGFNPFTVEGGAGRDMLIWDETGRLGAAYPAYFEDGSDGTFAGSIASSSFSGIEQVNVALSDADNYAFVDTAPLAAGATMNLDGGAGSDRLDVDFSSYADTTFSIDASGTALTSHGIYGHFEHFGMALGGGTNTVTTGAGDDTIYSLGGIDKIDAGAGFDSWGGDYSEAGAALTFAWNGGAGTATLSNGTTLAGLETGYLIGGSSNDVFTLAGLQPFDVFGGDGADRLVRDDSGLVAANTTNVIYGAGGSFFGWLANGQFDGIEQIAATLSGANESVFVDAAPLAAGAQLVLDGGAGSDALLADFSAISGLTFTVAANGATTSSVGTFRGFESFSLGLGGGTNTIVTSGGADSIQALQGGTNAISTGAGDDEVWGASGTETVDGGTGIDTFRATSLAAGYSLTRDGLGGYILTDTNLADGNDGIDRLTNVEWVQFADQRVALAAYSVAVTLTGTAGADTLTGTDYDDTLSGLGGNDILIGGGGADTMTGGTGNDLFAVDNAGDRTIEIAGEGTDTVRAAISWTLGANLENLELGGTAAISGTGNDLANSLIGNAAANVLSGLAGNDRLDGAEGADRLIGGSGNDTYVVDNAADSVIEEALGGTDTVYSTASFTLSANVERLVLDGTAALSGTGNELANALTGNAASNALFGLAGNDTLDGGAGADTLVGGTGNDTYLADNAGDIVTELGGEGTDLVQSSVTWILGANIEKLTLSGIFAIDGTGNSLANTLTGNGSANVLSGLAGSDKISAGPGDDILIGGVGADTLTGGSGADRFRFDVLDTASNKDTITDFIHGTDKLEISRSAFAAFGADPAGALSATEFYAGKMAVTADQHLIYNSGTGALYYDADGSGGAAQVQIALLSTRPVLDAGDFLLI